MANYFLNITKQDKENILNKHRTVYDGFVTQYGQSINNQPLYVQDFANDKNGITVSNKGVVKNYTNVNINESMIPIDNINSSNKITLDIKPEKKIERGDWVDELMSNQEEVDEIYNEQEFFEGMDQDDVLNLENNLQESLDMFKRFKKYN